MLDKKLCLTSVIEFLRRGRVDRGTREGKVVVVIDLSKRKVECRYHNNHGVFLFANAMLPALSMHLKS